MSRKSDQQKQRRMIALSVGAALAFTGAFYFLAIRPGQQEAAALDAIAQQIREAPASSETPAPKPKAVPRVAFLGDSYTAGTGATDDAKRWTTLLAKSEGWTERNHGFGGTNYGTRGAIAGGTTFAERVPKVAADKPTVVVVSGGRNDLGADQSAGIAATFDSLREELPKAKIIAIAPMWDDDAAPAQLAVVASQVRAAVESVGGEYVDAKNPLTGNPELVAPDGVHPDDEGHAAIAKAVAAAL